MRALRILAGHSGEAAKDCSRMTKWLLNSDHFGWRTQSGAYARAIGGGDNDGITAVDSRHNGTSYVSL